MWQCMFKFLWLYSTVFHGGCYIWISLKNNGFEQLLCVYCLFLYLQWIIVHSDPLPILNLDCLFIVEVLNFLFCMKIKNLQIFCSILSIVFLFTWFVSFEAQIFLVLEKSYLSVCLLFLMLCHYIWESMP
jgi:hypothetical protein